jgi:hypothetical protein
MEPVFSGRPLANGLFYRPSSMLARDHLSLAHHLWEQIIRPGDCVIDATLGKGRDALKLARLCLGDEAGCLIGLDIQAQAVESSRTLLAAHLPEQWMRRVKLIEGDHAVFPADLQPESVRLIVYNLGYLPGGDESLITTCQGTLQSLRAALELLQPGGAISCTCYSGHPGGDEEEKAVLAWASSLPRSQWTVTHTRWLNRRKGPSLLIVEKLV